MVLLTKNKKLLEYKVALRTSILVRLDKFRETGQKPEVDWSSPEVRSVENGNSTRH